MPKTNEDEIQRKAFDRLAAIEEGRPRDDAERIEAEFESREHVRAGKGATKSGNEHSVKVRSVRDVL
jgi:hypothetical protein